MDHLVSILAVMMLTSLCFADSDSTGVLAGSVEPVVIALSNSSGLFNANANCSMRVWNPSNVLILNVSVMSSYGDGRFYYAWNVPGDIGTYGVLFNCTDSAKGNYTAGGSIYVVSRLFEKAVAHGEIVYAQRYETLVETSNNDANWWLVAGVIIVLVLAGAVSYSKMGR